jgi:hypothetical protein
LDQSHLARKIAWLERDLGENVHIPTRHIAVTDAGFARSGARHFAPAGPAVILYFADRRSRDGGGGTRGMADVYEKAYVSTPDLRHWSRFG